MIYLMEVAASKAVQPGLSPGWVTVGVDVDVRRPAPTPVDRTVTAWARVIRVTERLIEFAARAREGSKLIGQGTHNRAPIDLVRFEKALLKPPARTRTGLTENEPSIDRTTGDQPVSFFPFKRYCLSEVSA